MKHVIAILFLVLPSLSLAQTAIIQGKVMDKTTGNTIDYADVIVTDLSDKVIASGMVSNGTFTVDKIPAQEVLLMVRMLGYNTYVSEKINVEANATLNLGTIFLEQLAKGLQEVVVVGEKNQIVYKLDRQAINGSSSVTASGGTAVDILATTPSVLVSPEGDLTFRGSTGFLVYVDGKLSPLEGTEALRQIPASTIQDIELITTPSARYRTEGDVGIINITTKRALVSGLSGLVNVSGSTHGTWSVDANINYQLKKHNFYIGTNLQDIANRSNFKQEKNTVVNNINTVSLADGERWSDNYTRVAKAGWQYVDAKHHNLSLDLQYGQTSNWRGGNMNYIETRSNATTHQEISKSEYDAHDKYDLKKNLFQAALTYILKLTDRTEINATSRFRYDWNSLEYTESNLFIKNIRYEGTRGYEVEHHWDCDGNLSIKHNYSPTGKIEAGYQYTTYSEHGDYNIKYWDREKEDFEWQTDQTTPFYYRRQTHSVYGMINDQIGRFSFDAGVRGDHVKDFGDVPLYNLYRNHKYFKLFPSAHVGFDGGKAGTISVGYSYRTNRPGVWKLEPYITYIDYFSMLACNPNIRPEYIHSFEVNYRKSFGGGNSLSLTGYYRDRKDIVDEVRTPFKPGVTLDSIVNAGNQVEKGLEMSLVIKPTRWWNSTVNASLFHYDFTATIPVCTDTNGSQFTASWLNNFSIGKSTKVQFDSHYIGRRILTQGYEKAYAYFDLGIRQPLYKGKIAVSVVAHDVFHTARYYNYRKMNDMMATNWVRPKYPNLVASISYNFNASKHKTTAVSTNLFEGKNF